MADTVARLRNLAKTKTQAESARALGLTRGRVSQIAGDERIKFRPSPRPKRRVLPPVCKRCRIALNGNKRCLRCKWTPTRIKRLRKSLGLSQVVMSIKLGRNLWAVQRWEARKSLPNRKSCLALERLERLAAGLALAPVKALSPRN